MVHAGGARASGAISVIGRPAAPTCPNAARLLRIQ